MGEDEDYSWMYGDSGGGGYDDYYGPTDYGQGGISSGGGDWQPISAPPQYEYNPGTGYRMLSAGDYDASRGAAPNSRTTGYGDQNYTPSYSSANGNWASPSSSYGGGGGGAAPRPGGGSGYTQPPYQRVNPGAPQSTLFNHYQQMLLNPEGMAQDPAYKFLFNQGEQALNRSLAAKRLTYSGKALNDTTAYGQGMAFDYMNKMLPQYGAGASQELQRYAVPMGLYMQSAGINNNATNMEGSNRAAQELMPYYQQMMQQGGGGGGAAPAIGFGGASSRYMPQQQPQQYQPRLAQSYGPQGGYDNDAVISGLFNDLDNEDY